jgi:hypothetical protein
MMAELAEFQYFGEDVATLYTSIFHAGVGEFFYEGFAAPHLGLQHNIIADGAAFVLTAHDIHYQILRRRIMSQLQGGPFKGRLGGGASISANFQGGSIIRIKR